MCYYSLIYVFINVFVIEFVIVGMYFEYVDNVFVEGEERFFVEMLFYRNRGEGVLMDILG